ncbi:hypothetical protein E2542_SST21901 [Spatholobus suberectus]|nr:hypothetical protein E2542_SST21901 [Spatholobus suberectus]
MQEDLKCVRDLKDTTMQMVEAPTIIIMFCSHHLLFVCTRVKGWRKGTVQVNNGEAYRLCTPHRGGLLFSKSLRGNPNLSEDPVRPKLLKVKVNNIEGSLMYAKVVTVRNMYLYQGWHVA